MFGVEKGSFDRRHRFYKLCLEVCTLTAYCSEYVKGTDIDLLYRSCI